MKQRYFELFDQMDAEDAAMAKAAFDPDFAKAYPYPPTLAHALANGFNWGLSGGFRMWGLISRKYRNLSEPVA